MNIGRQKNVPSYEDECVFFFELFRVYFNFLKIANIGELQYGVLGTAPKFGLREEIKFVPVFKPSNQRPKGNLTLCSYRL